MKQNPIPDPNPLLFMLHLHATQTHLKRRFIRSYIPYNPPGTHTRLTQTSETTVHTFIHTVQPPKTHTRLTRLKRPFIHTYIPSNWRLSNKSGISKSKAKAKAKAKEIIMTVMEKPIQQEVYSSKPEIAFFDVETTVPTRPGQGFALLEFGAILVCPKKLEEIRSYSTLIRPTDPNLITSLSVRCNGITPDAVVSSPSFSDVADTVYEILHGRIWAGHNIVRFDCVRIREAFSVIGKTPPEPKGIIDSLALLTQRFGRRAGDMKMASLATYFGLGKQTHRSLDDVRMNLEVLKYCATVLFLESSLPETFPENHWVSPNATTRSRRHGKSPIEEVGLSTNASSSSLPETGRAEGNHPIFSLVTSNTTKNVPSSVASNTAQSDPFDLGALSNVVNTASLQPDLGFIKPDEVSVPSISAISVPFHHGSPTMKLFYEGAILQLYCSRLKVRFGLSTRFTDQNGRPRLSFVVDAPPILCGVLDACDSITQKAYTDSGSNSDWRHAVTRKEGYANYPTVRLHIPTAVKGDIAEYGTELYQKEPSGTAQELVFSEFNPAELDTWFQPGTFVDSYFSVDPYNYQQCAGIRLVAKKLIIHSK